LHKHSPVLRVEDGCRRGRGEGATLAALGLSIVRMGWSALHLGRWPPHSQCRGRRFESVHLHHKLAVQGDGVPFTPISRNGVGAVGVQFSRSFSTPHRSPENMAIGLSTRTSGFKFLPGARATPTLWSVGTIRRPLIRLQASNYSLVVETRSHNNVAPLRQEADDEVHQ